MECLCKQRRLQLFRGKWKLPAPASAHALAQTRAYTHTRTNLFVRICIHLHAYMHPQTYMPTHPHAWRTRMYVRTHVPINMRTHAGLVRCCTVRMLILRFSLYDFSVRVYDSPIKSSPDSRHGTKIRHAPIGVSARWMCGSVCRRHYIAGGT